jgi:hypoxanthine phosphoribosyltransferase
MTVEEEAAEEYFKDFVKKSKYIINNNEKYPIEAIIAPGNGGVVMAELFSRICAIEKKWRPPIIQLAVYRPSADNKNIPAKTDEKNSPDIKNISPYWKHVLIIDDETGTGRTINECIKFTKSKINNGDIKFYVLVQPYNSNNYSNYESNVNFISFAEKIRDNHCYIKWYFLRSTDSLKTIVNCLYEANIDTNQAINVALNVPVKINLKPKEAEISSSVFTNYLNVLCSEILGDDKMREIRKQFDEKINELISNRTFA